MRCFCITDDPDVLTGMRLAGIEGLHASTKKDVDAAVSRVCADSGIAILIITEGCYALSRERLDELKLSAGRPLVNVIADSRGSVRQGLHHPPHKRGDRHQDLGGRHICKRKKANSRPSPPP